jgi:hypothetical protein
MKTYQIELSDGKGTKGWLYYLISEILSKSEIEKGLQRQVKNDYLKELQALKFSVYNLSRKAIVKEYDNKSSKPVRNGHRFKMSW